MKKLLVLNGTAIQTNLIRAAHEENYYVILCEAIPTFPGVKACDKYYQVDPGDKDKVLEIAQKEQVDGVISNHELNMQTVAYVAEKMGLRGTSLQSVRNLDEKASFRKVQHELGVFSPEYILSSTFEEMLEGARQLHFPIVMKPNFSSGSRGTTFIESYEELCQSEEAWNRCSDYSVDGMVEAEEAVEMSRLDGYVEGDVFVLGDRIFWGGLGSGMRSPKLKALDMTDTYPIIATEDEFEDIKREIELQIRGAGISYGEYNIEMYRSESGKMFIIEINSRQSGGGMPHFIMNYSGVDLYKMLVTTAIGDDSYFDEVCNSEIKWKYVCRQFLMPFSGGVFKGIRISDEIRPYVVKASSYVSEGHLIKDNNIWAGDILGFVDLGFSDRETQLAFMNIIEEHIAPIIEPGYSPS